MRREPLPLEGLRAQAQRARAWSVFYALTGNLGPSLLALAVGGWLLAGLETLGASPEVRRGVWGAVGLAALGVVLRRPLPVVWRLLQVAEKLGEHPRDEYRIALELAARGEEGPFVRLMWAGLPPLLEPRLRRALCPKGWSGRARAGFWGVLFLAGLVFLVPEPFGLLWPFGPDPIPGLLSVEPGNARVPRGASVPVSVVFAEAPPTSPVLWVKDARSGWTTRPWGAKEGGLHSAVLSSLREPTSYRVSLSGRRSGCFQLIPFDPPRLATFQLEITPPAYTKRPKEKAENPFAPEVYAGSSLKFSGVWETPAKALRLTDDQGGEVSIPLDGLHFEWQETARTASRRRLWGGGADGTPLTPVGDIVLSLKEDLPPEVRWWLPGEDLTVSPTEELPLVYEVRDDFGVRDIYLEYAINGKKEERRLLKASDAGENEGTERRESLWRLSALGLQTGDVVTARLVARDESPNGPAGISETRLLRVAVVDREPDDWKAAFQAFQKALQAHGQEQSSIARATVDTSAARAAAAARQSEIGPRLKKEAEGLETLADRWEAFSGGDEFVAEEFRFLAEDLGEVSGRAASAADSLLTGNRGPAEEMAAALERLSRSAERTAQNQAALDLWSAADDVARQSESAAEALSGLLSPAARERLAKALDRLEESIRDLTERLRDRSTAVSESFLREMGASSLPLDQMGQELRRLRDALARGDGAAALEAANKLAKWARAMESSFLEAGGASWGESEENPVLRDLSDQAEALTRRQEALLETTQSVWAGVQKKREERQKQFLARLPDLKEEATSLRALWDTGKETPPAGRVEAVVAEARLQAVLRGAAEGGTSSLVSDLRDAETALRSLSTLLREARAAGYAVPIHTEELEKKYNSWDETGRRALSLADAIARGLSPDASPEGDDLTPEAGQVLGEGAHHQAALAEDGRRFLDKLTSLVKESLLIKESARRRFQDAVAYMSGAAVELQDRRLTSGMRAQEKALERLREGARSMMAGGSPMAIPGGAGPGTAGRRGGRRVGRGTGGGGVKLPAPESFRPPEDFRKELKDRMKERVPSTYEKIIRDYYRHWSK